MASRPFAVRDFDANKFSSGFFYIIVTVVILLIAGVASSAIRYARRSRRRRATTEDDFTTDRSDQQPPNTINPSLITQLQNLFPEPYALSSYPSQRTLDEPLTPLQSCQLRELPTNDDTTLRKEGRRVCLYKDAIFAAVKLRNEAGMAFSQSCV